MSREIKTDHTGTIPLLYVLLFQYTLNLIRWFPIVSSSQVQKQNRHFESEVSRHSQKLSGCFLQGGIAMLIIKIAIVIIDGRK